MPLHTSVRWVAKRRLKAFVMTQLPNRLTRGMFSRPRCPRSDHLVQPLLLRLPDELADVARGVRVVAVHDDEVGCRDVLERCAHGVRLPLPLLEDHACSHRLGDLPGPVGAAAVDDEDVAPAARFQLLDHLPDGLLLVERGDHDRHGACHRARVVPAAAGWHLSGESGAPK
jgi:hypothetical protein